MSLMNIYEKAKADAMAKAIVEARRRSFAVRIPENIADDRMYNSIDLGLKVWDVLTGLLEIASTVKLAAGAGAAAKISLEAIAATEAAAQAAAMAGASTKVTTALTVGEAISLAGPLVAYVGLWVALGAPYLEVKQQVAQDRARRGVVHGALIGAFGHSPKRAREFLLRQNESVNNAWVPGVKSVAENSYRMAFIAGYKQGRDMSQGQRKVFWKVFANSLRQERVRLWDNDWQDDQTWDRWFWDAGVVFMKLHLS